MNKENFQSRIRKGNYTKSLLIKYSKAKSKELDLDDLFETNTYNKPELKGKYEGKEVSISIEKDPKDFIGKNYKSETDILITTGDWLPSYWSKYTADLNNPNIHSQIIKENKSKFPPIIITINQDYFANWAWKKRGRNFLQALPTLRNESKYEKILFNIRNLQKYEDPAKILRVEMTKIARSFFNPTGKWLSKEAYKTTRYHDMYQLDYETFTSTIIGRLKMIINLINYDPYKLSIMDCKEKRRIWKPITKKTLKMIKRKAGTVEEKNEAEKNGKNKEQDKQEKKETRSRKNLNTGFSAKWRKWRKFKKKRW